MARAPPPPVSHDGLLLISGEKQICAAIKERERELAPPRPVFSTCCSRVVRPDLWSCYFKSARLWNDWMFYFWVFKSCKSCF